MPTAHTLVDLLRRQAERYRGKVAFSFSYNGDGEDEGRLRYRELDVMDRAIAADLRGSGSKLCAGGRVPGRHTGKIAGFSRARRGIQQSPTSAWMSPSLRTMRRDGSAGERRKP